MPLRSGKKYKKCTGGGLTTAWPLGFVLSQVPNARDPSASSGQALGRSAGADRGATIFCEKRELLAGR